MSGRRPAPISPEHLLFRRKPHPLPHVFNPLSKAFEATVQLPDQPSSDHSAKPTSRFHLAPKGKTFFDASVDLLTLFTYVKHNQAMKNGLENHLCIHVGAFILSVPGIWKF